MPRKARIDIGGACYHVLNRGNERQTIFHDDSEYGSFLQLIERARRRQGMRIIAYCLMPNHFHLCLWPVKDGDRGKFMQWLMTGHVWQGRYKASITQDDFHLLSVMRYILRNPVRANLVSCPEEWQWSSAVPTRPGEQGVLTHRAPLNFPIDWNTSLHLPENSDVVTADCKKPLTTKGHEGHEELPISI